MYHELPPIHCSKCYSINSESFENRKGKGIRCLSCGHEVINKPKKQSEPISWVSDRSEPDTF